MKNVRTYINRLLANHVAAACDAKYNNISVAVTENASDSFSVEAGPRDEDGELSDLMIEALRRFADKAAEQPITVHPLSPDPRLFTSPRDIVRNDGDSADISGHESLKREAVNRLNVHLSDGYMWEITSDSPITVRDLTKKERDAYYGEDV